MSDTEFYKFARDFFGLRKAGNMEKTKADASTAPDPEPDQLPDRFARDIKSCLAHVRAVTWGEAKVDFEINDGDVRLEIHMSVKSVSKAVKVEKKP
jgi:hypothetical protein